MRLLLVFALALSLLADELPRHGTFVGETISVGGKERQYRLVVPDSVDFSQPAPLVCAFHGRNDSMRVMPLYSRLDELAAKERFILVYPNGLERKWG